MQLQRSANESQVLITYLISNVMLYSEFCLFMTYRSSRQQHNQVIIYSDTSARNVLIVQV